MIPLETTVERLTGDMRKSYDIQIGPFTLPLWPWTRTEFAKERIEKERKQFRIRNWEFPIAIIEKTNYESISEKKSMTKAEAIEKGVEQAKADLLLKLGEGAKILSEKVLHETIDHGKVNLSLYITVEENIAIGKPISQGD